MSGSLSHPVAEILGRLLVDLAVGTGGTTEDWSVYIESEPDEPDEVITVYSAANILEGRAMPTGEQQEQHGFQVRIRSADYEAGWARANSVCTKFDTEVLRTAVTLDSTTYIVHSVDRTSGPFYLGKETPESRRDLWTINGTASIRQVA